MSGGRQAAIIAVGVLVTAAVFGVSRWATQPTMVPLYADVPVDQVKKVTDKLTELNIAYKLDPTGTSVLVSSSDLVRARVDMAAESTVGGGRPGLEIFDKPQWGSTDFTQNINRQRAFEGELERSIGKLNNVQAVQVHLALEDDKLFKQSERKSKASVTLTMAGGIPPKPEMVSGIARLVAGSISGLEAEQVTIVDSPRSGAHDAGRRVARRHDQPSAGGAARN
jgi:flagellar M-ring protein FliF